MLKHFTSRMSNDKFKYSTKELPPKKATLKEVTFCVKSIQLKRNNWSVLFLEKSYREIEALTSVTRDVLRLWKARARNDEAWVLEVERRSLISYEEKEEIVRLHSLGDSITDSAIRFNVYRTTVKSIINSHRKREGKPAKPVQSQFLQVPLLLL